MRAWMIAFAATMALAAVPAASLAAQRPPTPPIPQGPPNTTLSFQLAKLQTQVNNLSDQVAALQAQLAAQQDRVNGQWSALQGQISGLTQGLSTVSANLGTLQQQFRNHTHSYVDASSAMGIDSVPNMTCNHNGPVESNCFTSGIVTIMTYAGHNATQGSTSTPHY